ncbi:hypothetical protein F5887DRAFT_1283115 [Amanita rubescens]|nr:hypothetical protein F5887DRAFT_1283115 [Amanita rubescens]
MTTNVVFNQLGKTNRLFHSIERSLFFPVRSRPLFIHALSYRCHQIAVMATLTVDTGFIVGISTGHAIAVVSTCLRLVFKTIKRRLWWDDFWALISLILLIATWIASVDIPNPRSSKLESLWIVSYQALSLISLWSARLSLAVIIVRLCPQGTMRIICKWVAVLFGVAAIALILYKTIDCGLYYSAGVEFCAFDTAFAVVETAFDIIADSWLVGAPIHMVCRMKLPGRHLRMLVAIFALNILTTFASIAHSVLSLLHMNQASFIAGNVQCATSLFVCNLLVLVTFLYRRIRGNAEETTISEHPETITRSRARYPPTGPSGPAMARIELTVVSRENRSTGAARPAIYGDSLPPPPCELSPTSTFPDLPPRRRPLESHRPTTSQKSLMPLACNLSVTSTFPDLPIIRHIPSEPEIEQPVPSSSQHKSEDKNM